MILRERITPVHRRRTDHAPVADSLIVISSFLRDGGPPSCNQPSPWASTDRPSLAAARWAADEAEKRKLPLRLLHAWPMLAPEPPRVAGEVDQNYWAKRLVHTAQAELKPATRA